MAAVVAGLLPICTRKSKACFWTAVNHSSSARSAPNPHPHRSPLTAHLSPFTLTLTLTLT